MYGVARLVLVSLMVTILLPGAVVGAEDPEDKLTQEYWLGIYLKDTKLGDVHVKTEEAELDGKAVIRRERNWRLELHCELGKINAEATDVVYVTPSMEPLLIEFDVVGYSPDGEKAVFGGTVRYEDNKCVIMVQGLDGKEMTATEPYDEEDPKQLAAGFAHDIRGDLPVASSKVDMARYLMEVQLTPKQFGINFASVSTALLLVGPQQIEIGKNTYDTMVVVEDERDPDEEPRLMRRWLLKDGGIVKEEREPSGITLLRESREEATSSGDACPETPAEPVEEKESSSGAGAV